MTRPIRTLIVTTAAVAALLLGGCESDASGPIPDGPTPTTSGSAEPDWYGDYSPEQIEAFDTAVQLIAASDKALEPIWRSGQATAEAQATFQKYRADWQLYFISLTDNQSDGIKLTRRPEVLSSRPVSIDLSGDGPALVIEQCVDTTVVQPTQNGEPIAEVVSGPTTRTVYVSQYGEQQLLRDGQEEIKPCDG